MTPRPSTAVEVSWIPLGAGGHSVRFNGRVFEAVPAWREHRSRSDVYHAALRIITAASCFVIEPAPRKHRPGQLAGWLPRGHAGGLDLRVVEHP